MARPRVEPQALPRHLVPQPGIHDPHSLARSQSLAYTSPVEVVWDEAKNVSNQRRHRVSFDEAAELFESGVEYLEIFDEEHSDTEDRFIALGPIARGLVVIVWTERDEETIRIISARWATRRERALYVSYLEPRP